MYRAEVAAADSRPGDVDPALEHAGELAARTGEGNAYWLGFGPANTGFCRVSVALDLKDYDVAVAPAEGVDPRLHSNRSRQAAYWVYYDEPPGAVGVRTVEPRGRHIWSEARSPGREGLRAYVSADRTSRNARRSPGATRPKMIVNLTVRRATTVARSAPLTNAGPATIATQTGEVVLIRSVRRGSQIICATHSPLLAAFPQAHIIEVRDRGKS